LNEQTTIMDATQKTLWVTDAELIRRMGVPEKIARQAIRMLDADRTRRFPQKSKLWGNRRYWPAVKAWLDSTNSLTLDASQPRRQTYVR
jgi:hypothetical protein